MKAKALLRVTSVADVRLFVDGKKVSLTRGSGSSSVTLADETLLSWTVVGDPATTYEVAIAAEKGLKVEMLSGSNPTESHIPKRYFTAAGSVRFKLTAGVV